MEELFWRAFLIRWLAAEGLVHHQPRHGVRLTAEGRAVILVSSELPELMGMSKENKMAMDQQGQPVMGENGQPARVRDVVKAVLEVANFLYATSQLGQTTLRSVLGEVDLDTLLSEREKLNARLQTIQAPKDIVLVSAGAIGDVVLSGGEPAALVEEARRLGVRVSLFMDPAPEAMAAARDGVEGLITVLGGKATTMRAMAEQTADMICRKTGRAVACRTQQAPLLPYRRFWRRA